MQRLKKIQMFRWSLPTVILAATANASGVVLCPATINATPESHACMEAAIGKAEARLNQYLQAAQLEANANSTEPPQLLATQERWLAYRDKQCGDAYLFWLSGTYRYEASLRCRYEITNSRTHEVWATFLVRFGGSPPVLPEP